MWLTLKSDKEAIKSSNSLVADEARGPVEFEFCTICRSISWFPPAKQSEFISYESIIRNDFRMSHQNKIGLLASYVPF